MFIAESMCWALATKKEFISSRQSSSRSLTGWSNFLEIKFFMEILLRQFVKCNI
jgi:hypothetical protein